MKHSVVLGFGRNPVYIRVEKQKMSAPECVCFICSLKGKSVYSMGEEKASLFK